MQIESYIQSYIVIQWKIGVNCLPPKLPLLPEIKQENIFQNFDKLMHNA